jgi:hypothetical protein
VNTTPDSIVSALRWGLIEANARRDLRARLFPENAACSCGVSNPLLLILCRTPACCYECDLLRRTGSRFELHHIGGADSPIAVRMPGNRHRLHDAAYQDVLEQLPLTPAVRLWIELQLFLAFERMLGQPGRAA